ncbi:MAG: histone H1-like repetitive region-containing protein [Desulfobacterales bacterium]
MGKKDLLKSTSKAKKTEKKKAALQKAAPKKAAPKKAAPTKKLTGKELLLEKFDTWKPSKLFKAEPDKAYLDNFKSPPFYDDKAKEDVSKINKLLALQFDMKAIIAAGEKAAAEKAAAEKAAAEKAAAEKAAAEKAAAEKAAAEKAAAEKAAAEKAAAEKAAAEKAAAEKAAAEKAAAEKAAAEKAADSRTMEGADPSRKILFAIAACLILIFTPIIIASYINTGNYYLKTADGALEIYQGDFAPMGKELLITLPGGVPPKTIEDVYSKEKVFPIVCNYLIDKADTLLKVNGLPDFQYIKSTLNTAKTYAVTKPLLQRINKRLTGTDFMVFLYKADVAAGKGTVEGRDEAIGLLEKAAMLDLDSHEAEMVSKKIQSLQKIKTVPKKNK